MGRQKIRDRVLRHGSFIQAQINNLPPIGRPFIGAGRAGQVGPFLAVNPVELPVEHRVTAVEGELSRPAGPQVQGEEIVLLDEGQALAVGGKRWQFLRGRIVGQLSWLAGHQRDDPEIVGAGHQNRVTGGRPLVGGKGKRPLVGRSGSRRGIEQNPLLSAGHVVRPENRVGGLGVSP